MEEPEQLSLALFSPSFEQLLSEKEICTLSVEISTRMKKSWYVKICRKTGQRNLIIPTYLQEAPEQIKLALIQWAQLPLVKTGKNRRTIGLHKTSLENTIRSYIQSLPGLHHRISRFDPHTLQHHTRGTRYDLREIFNSINRRYFNDSLNASLRWGSRTSTTSYQTVKTARDGSRFNLITIAGVYNHPDVPRFAIEAVMYHEMLHIAVPPFRKNGRNVIHGSDFKNLEKKFEFFSEWHVWERLHLRKLARSLRIKTTK